MFTSHRDSNVKESKEQGSWQEGVVVRGDPLPPMWPGFNSSLGLCASCRFKQFVVGWPWLLYRGFSFLSQPTSTNSNLTRIEKVIMCMKPANADVARENAVLIRQWKNRVFVQLSFFGHQFCFLPLGRISHLHVNPCAFFWVLCNNIMLYSLLWTVGDKLCIESLKSVLMHLKLISSLDCALSRVCLRLLFCFM